MLRCLTVLPALFMLAFQPHGVRAEGADGSLDFNDAPLISEVRYPDWFKQSFLILGEDLQEAVDAGKKGIIVYFGQKHCPYCQALMKHDFGQDDIAAYTRKYFDVIAIDIWGSKEVTTIDGIAMSERAYARKEKATFTPTLIFYDATGRKALMLRGYYPPYKFRAALEYVAKGYYRQESFRQYITRADPLPKFEEDGLNEQDFFMPPPYALDRTRFRAQRPLLVLFEQPECHACDLLHSRPFADDEILKLLRRFDVVQLNMKSDTPVWTPDGQKLTARRWADQLGLIYAPTLIFFDEGGREIIRVDSVAHIYRLKNVLRFVAGKAYRDTPDYSAWRFDILFGGKKLPALEDD